MTKKHVCSKRSQAWVLYYAQERLSQKKLSLSDEYQYTSAVNGFPGAYDPDGSGKISKMPDDKNYSLKIC